MKRAFAFLSTILVLITSCDDGDPSPAAAASDHRISKILNFAHSTDPEPYNFMNLTYDSHGNLIKEELFDFPSTLTTYTDYEYDGNKRIRKNNYDGQVGNLTLGTYIKYSFTNSHVTKEELFLGNGTLKFTTYYEYMGDNLVNTYKDGDGLGIHHQYKYVYDLLGRLTLEQSYMYDQELDSFVKYFYDDDNRMIRSERYDHNSELTSATEKKYTDSDSLPDQQLEFDANGNITIQQEIEYDSYGHETAIIVDGQAMPCKLVSRKYDGELLIEEIRYHPYFGYSEWWVTRYEYEKI